MDPVDNYLSRLSLEDIHDQCTKVKYAVKTNTEISHEGRVTYLFVKLENHFARNYFRSWVKSRAA